MTDAEYRREKRAVAVPFFFKRKIFMVFMMMVCSGIMAVAATYAWFILSTAPEVVGVSTTVGANGSLIGYAGGVDKKVKLLELEHADMRGFFVPKKGTAR